MASFIHRSEPNMKYLGNSSSQLYAENTQFDGVLKHECMN